MTLNSIDLFVSASEEALNQVAESVASHAVAEAEAEGVNDDNNDVSNENPTREPIEDEVIQAVEEAKLGDTGVSSTFVKQVLEGKEIIFVIGDLFYHEYLINSYSFVV